MQRSAGLAEKKAARRTASRGRKSRDGMAADDAAVEAPQSTGRRTLSQLASWQTGLEAAEASLGDVLDFLRVLWAVDHGLQSTSKHMEMRHGITGQQRMAVRVVGRFPGISAGTLAKILHLHPSTLTGVLRRLKDRGYIDRVVDSADRRRTVLRLTESGQDIDLLQAGTVEAAAGRVMRRLGKARLLQAMDVLRALAHELTGETY